MATKSPTPAYQTQQCNCSACAAVQDDPGDQRAAYVSPLGELALIAQQERDLPTRRLARTVLDLFEGVHVRLDDAEDALADVAMDDEPEDVDDPAGDYELPDDPAPVVPVIPEDYEELRAKAAALDTLERLLLEHHDLRIEWVQERWALFGPVCIRQSESASWSESNLVTLAQRAREAFGVE